MSTQDTSQSAESILIDLIRSQSPTERLQLALSASRRVAEQCKRAIGRQNPEFSEDELNLRFIELNYGKKLADEVRDSMATRLRS
jgi:hypothetical protein